MRLILFCKNDKKELLWDDLEHKNYQKEMGIEEERYVLKSDKQYSFTKNLLNGKAVLECDYEVEKIFQEFENKTDRTGLFWYQTNNLNEKELLVRSGLTMAKLSECLEPLEQKYIYGKGWLIKPNGYAIHIKNIQVYNTPREKKEYDHIVGKYYPEDLRIVSHLGMEVKYVEQIERKIFSKNVTCMRVIDYMALECTSLEMYNILKGNQSILIRKRLNKKFLG